MNGEAAPPQDTVGSGLWLGALEEGAEVCSRLALSEGTAVLQWSIWETGLGLKV